MSFAKLSAQSFERLQHTAQMLAVFGKRPDSPWGLNAVQDRYRATAGAFRLALEGLRQRGGPTAKDADGLFRILWWRRQIKPETRRRAIEALALPVEQSRQLGNLIDAFVDRMNALGDDGADIGCWGTGKAKLEYDLGAEGALEWFYGLLFRLLDAQDREEAYGAVESFVDATPSGLAKGVVTPMLYALRPTDFPVLNAPIRKTIRDALGMRCGDKLGDVVDWSRSAVVLNQRLGLPPDLATFDRLFYDALPDAVARGWTPVASLDRRAMEATTATQASDGAGFMRAKAELDRWIEEDEDWERGFSLLAGVMHQMAPHVGEGQIEGALRRPGMDGLTFWGHVSDVYGWEFGEGEPWPVALSALLDAIPGDLLSWALAAVGTDEDPWCPVNNAWWEEVSRLDIVDPATESLVRREVRDVLGDDLSESEVAALTERILPFTTRVDELRFLRARYGAHGARTVPFFEILFRSAWRL